MKILKTLCRLGLVTLISCSSGPGESSIEKKAKAEFLKNENKLYQESKIDQRAKPIAYKISFIKSENAEDLGIGNVGFAYNKCNLGITEVEYGEIYGMPIIRNFKGVLEIAWVDIAAKCPSNGCYLSQERYVSIKYGFAKDKYGKWCLFVDSFQFDGKYSSIGEKQIKEEFNKL